MEISIFDESFFQIRRKNEKSKNRNFRNFPHFFWEVCKSVLGKKPRFFSFHPVYPSAKGRRDLKIKAYGVIFHGEFDFELIILPNH